ncbi:hypothetical protein GCM10011367_10340 [Marinicauda pacifica]|uniref:Glycoside hydrolase family 5 domain-containing protein n=1 Tax=Marinicauda pacifica TaxID=1133559 RepID=A0A4S2HFR7_9PROT|nr:glycoside hydrolase family 5 protein [Marinicauda pacifica]TGY94678.1 hypothetical protein E5162_05250 [Marinicauda pacifica]GGE37871.1 hypothetical protein GCM10011367_10340 [Marinicauda pacifica]
MTGRRELLAGLAAGGISALLGAGISPALARPDGLRLGSSEEPASRRALWSVAGGPLLRGAVFAQRRVYPDLDGRDFLGSGPVGAPITDEALSGLREAGANLAVWSGPGPFSEAAPFAPDPAIVAEIETWLARCERQGLYTVLGFRTGPGRSAFAFHPEEVWYPRQLYDDSVWREARKQAAWVEMVDWAAERFGDAPALAGILAMVEPNDDWLGLPGRWDAMAERLAEGWRHPGVPLLLSPGGWADMAGADALRRRVGPDPVIVVHSYTPRDYTHQGQGDDVRWDGAELDLPRAAGDWACLEFGAVNAAPGQDDYLASRIAQFETAGASWAAFAWGNGWPAYEARENAMALRLSPPARTVLGEAFGANRVRP